jgi:hypothetical protein
MNAIRVALLLFLASWAYAGHAASFDPADEDCAKILQRWAEDPSSVPQRLVDLCKEKMAAVAPAPAALAAAPAPEAADPCTGPGAAGSVLCWGPWSTLAPAAEGPVAALDFPDYVGDCEFGNELDARCVAQYELPDEPPVEGCAPGTPCGFATMVDGITSHGDVEETEFYRFDLDPDGSHFTVDPGGDDEVDSVEMGVNIQPRNDGYENMRSTGTSGDEQSRLISRIVRDDEGRIELAADVWTHGNRQTGAARSGFFAWGTSTSQAGLDLLNGEGVSVAFAGPMSVDNATNAAITVDFGSRPAWSGTWTNPAWSFGAGGSVNGVNFLSNPGQFTGNVEAGSFVQGALLGEPGRQGIAHIIDVRLEGQGHIKDVGLLRQVTGGPAPTIIQP